MYFFHFIKQNSLFIIDFCIKNAEIQEENVHVDADGFHWKFLARILYDHVNQYEQQIQFDSANKMPKLCCTNGQTLKPIAFNDDILESFWHGHIDSAPFFSKAFYSV